jgi:hypothetical protein
MLMTEELPTPCKNCGLFSCNCSALITRFQNKRAIRKDEEWHRTPESFNYHRLHLYLHLRGKIPNFNRELQGLFTWFVFRSKKLSGWFNDLWDKNEELLLELLDTRVNSED